MGMTKIEWTQGIDGSAGFTWNPLRARHGGSVGHYCEMVSPGCAHCYASAMQRRFKMPAYVAGQRRGAVETFLDERVLVAPLAWRKPRMVFVASMTDLFGEWVDDATIDKVFAVMALTPQHTYQVLTKRAERMADYVNDPMRCIRWGRATGELLLANPGGNHGGSSFCDGVHHNIWMGCSVEDQQRANERIPHLLRTPAAVRFISVEPLLGPINIEGACWKHGMDRVANGYQEDAAYRARAARPLRSLDWVIVGCESNGSRVGRLNGARSPTEPHSEDIWRNWAGQIVAQCHLASAAAFVKQVPVNGRVSKDPAEWPEDLRVREWPQMKHVQRDAATAGRQGEKSYGLRVP